MQIAFNSSHVAGDFSRGLLTVGITRDEPLRGASVYDEVHFSVPADYHVHNDCVAAALLPLVERRGRSVQFNFGVSERCASILRDYYQLADIGPVDRSLEPRQPGRHIGLSFSGGLDSLGLWVILVDLLAAPVKVIHASFGSRYAREQINTAGYRLDVNCETDLRAKRFDQAGRFMATIPLLFADYADLGSVTFGHTPFHGPPMYVESLADGSPPGFLREDLALNAGGVHELHLVRNVLSWCTSKILVLATPQRVEAGLRASARPGSMKHAIKALTLRGVYERTGLPLPAFVDPWAPPRRPVEFGERIDADFWALYFLTTHGPQYARPLIAEIEQLVDRTALERLSFAFIERYNPNLIPLLPAGLRDPYLSLLHRFEILPYDEGDWHELEEFKRLTDIDHHLRMEGREPPEVAPQSQPARR